MTKIVSTATVAENDGLVVLLHLDTADAYETLRSNFAEEVAVGDLDGTIESLESQGIQFDVYMHDIDLSDVRVELPDAVQAYRNVYDALDSHAPGSAGGIQHCGCAGWSSAEDHTYTEHVARAVLTALGLPVRETS